MVVYLKTKSLLFYLIALSYISLIVLARSYKTGRLIRDDYEYALEGVAVDYVTNRPRGVTSSRIHKTRQRMNHVESNSAGDGTTAYHRREIF